MNHAKRCCQKKMDKQNNKAQRGNENPFTSLIVQPGILAYVSLFHRLSSLNAVKCNHCMTLGQQCKIRGMLAPSEIAIIVCGWLLIVRFAAEFIIMIPQGWAELILICFWNSLVDQSLISISLSEYISYHQAWLCRVMWCPCSRRHYTLHNNM